MCNVYGIVMLFTGKTEKRIPAVLGKTLLFNFKLKMRYKQPENLSQMNGYHDHDGNYCYVCFDRI